MNFSSEGKINSTSEQPNMPKSIIHLQDMEPNIHYLTIRVANMKTELLDS
jgi:hypothetical protein